MAATSYEEENRLILDIPLHYIQGTQNSDDYKRRKMRKVNRGLRQFGKEYLLNDPIFLGVLEVEKGLLLAIYEGHNRCRLAPKYDIHTIPSMLFTIEELAVMHKKNTGQELTKEMMLSYTYQVHRTFADRMQRARKQYPQKDLLPFRSIDELVDSIYYRPEVLYNLTHIRVIRQKQ